MKVWLSNFFSLSLADDLLVAFDHAAMVIWFSV
jgi:hypothetical protein